MSNEQSVGWWHEWTMADRLRVARERVASSQEEFALMSGISKGTISNYENGKPTTRRIVQIWAEKSGANLMWILTGVPAPPPSDDGQNVTPIGRGKARMLRTSRSRCTVVRLVPAA